MKVDRLLETYCTMDSATRSEMLATVESFMKQRGKVVYNSLEYQKVEDLRVDLESESKAKNKIKSLMF